MTVQRENLQQVADSFRAIAEVRAAGGYAPIYQQMAAGAATDPELLTIAAAAQPGQNPPSLLLGAAQYLVADHPDHPLIRFYPVLTGQPAPGHDPYPALRDFVLAQHEQITRLVATRLVQTNEPARSTYLYPALLTAQHLGGGQPLALIEIGSSAGLTLVPDRYSYDYGDGTFRADSTSPLRLHCTLRGNVAPPLDGTLCVAWRTGIDLHPLNLSDTADRRWLRALIWPDHPDRAERLDLAARAAARGPLPHIHQVDATECLPELVAQAPEDTTVVVFHTAVLAHFTQQARTAFEQRLHELSAQRPITWIQGEPRPDQHPRLQTRPTQRRPAPSRPPTGSIPSSRSMAGMGRFAPRGIGGEQMREWSAVDTEEARTIGRRVRQIRYARKKSLQVIAGLAGMSKSKLDRIERGEVALDRLSDIHALANALEIAPAELTRLPVPAPGNGGTDGAVTSVRLALIEVDLGSPDGQVLPIEVLRSRVDSLLEARRRCRFPEVGAALPALIRDLHTSISNAGRDVDELLLSAVTLHVHVTRMWLDDAGAPEDLRRQVAFLARKLAQEHGAVTTLGVAAFGSVYALLSEGMLDLAQQELDAVPMPATTRETAGLVGGLTMTHSLIAAVGKRLDDVAAPMDAAAEIAGRFGELGETDPLGFGFGPTNVGMRRMELALESGEPDLAVSIAQDVQPRRLPFATRQASSYWVRYGRALARVRHYEDAVRAFRTAEKIFPVRVQRDPIVRDVLAELVAHSRRDAVGRELRGMAYRAGLPV